VLTESLNLVVRDKGISSNRGGLWAWQRAFWPSGNIPSLRYCAFRSVAIRSMQHHGALCSTSARRLSRPEVGVHRETGANGPISFSPVFVRARFRPLRATLHAAKLDETQRRKAGLMTKKINNVSKARETLHTKKSSQGGNG
jgi:hypothetical protein